MRRKFKRKKKIKFKKIIFLIVSLIFIYFLCCKIEPNKEESKLLQLILNKDNIINASKKYINKTFFNSPTFILENSLNYKKENKITELVYKENEKPIVYIYNSHQGEEYDMKYLEEYNIVPTIMTAGNMLKDKLENLGIEAVFEDSDILEYMKKNKMKHADSYKASKIFLQSAIEKYPNAKLYIDLHRDAASHKSTTVNIENKDYAKILFVIGLEHPNYAKNLQVANEINNIILNTYPALTRGILKKQGYGVNGIYNQDLKENVILIEIGGNENNIDEVNNTLDLLSKILKEYIDEKK